MNAKKAAYLGVMTALAAVMSYVEALIPMNFGIPGIKPGFGNIVLVMLLYTEGTAEALIVSVMRILITGFLFGNASGMIYSFSGALPAVIAMSLLKRSGRFSTMGVSAGGGTVHNIGQLICALIVLPGLPAGIYLPYLLIAGCVTGICVGILSELILRRLPVGNRAYFT